MKTLVSSAYKIENNLSEALENNLSEALSSLSQFYNDIFS